MAYKQISPVPVIEGGTGAQSFVVDSPLCGGTTNTNPIQSVASLGNAGDVLTSNGASSLPAFTEYPTGGGWQLLSSQTVGSPVTYINFLSLISSMYDAYALVISGVALATPTSSLIAELSVDNGASWAPIGVFNGWADNSYLATSWTNGSSGLQRINLASESGGDATTFLNGVFYFYNLHSTSSNGSYDGRYVRAATVFTYQGISGGVFNNSLLPSPFNSMRLASSIGTGFGAGRFSLYGIQKS